MWCGNVEMAKDLGAGREGRWTKISIIPFKTNYFYHSPVRLVNGRVSSQLRLAKLKHTHIYMPPLAFQRFFIFSSADEAPLGNLQENTGSMSIGF